MYRFVCMYLDRREIERPENKSQGGRHFIAMPFWLKLSGKLKCSLDLDVHIFLNLKVRCYLCGHDF